MPQITKKIYATQSMTSRSDYKDTVLGTSLQAKQTADYNRTGYFNFYGIDTTTLPEFVTLKVYINSSDTTDVPAGELGYMSGQWDENTDYSNIPSYSTGYDYIKNKGWNEISVNKSTLINGFAFYPSANIYGSTMVSTRGDEEYRPHIEYETICPLVDGLTVTDNGDTVVCSWTQEDTQSWKLEVIKNNTTRKILTGTTDTTCTINKTDIADGGEINFKLTAYYEAEIVTKEVTETIDPIEAKILVLELPNTSINVDETFTVRWVSDNQSSFALELDGKIYTGTTQTSIIIPKSSISKGTKTVKLIVTYSNSYYSNSDTTSKSFVAYGKPIPPTFTTKSSYSSATPSVTWNSDEQTAYQLVIKHASSVIIDTGQVIGVNKYYITPLLTNGYTYTATLKVRNKYGLWSDEVSTSFTISFTMPNTPSIKAISDIATGSIIINVNTNIDNDTEYKNTEIWKREPGEDWKRMAYKLNATDVWQDFYVAGDVNYEYKARNIGKSGGISESDIVTAKTVVHGYNFYDVQDNNKHLMFECGDSPKPKINQTTTIHHFANTDAPTIFSDGLMYWTCTMNFTTYSRDDITTLYKLMKSKLLLYKDNKGHKWFGKITNSPEFQEDDVEIITIQLEFTQENLLEQDIYCGDNLELISWNGGWKFDGTHTFGGE